MYQLKIHLVGSLATGTCRWLLQKFQLHIRQTKRIREANKPNVNKPLLNVTHVTRSSIIFFEFSQFAYQNTVVRIFSAAFLLLPYITCFTTFKNLDGFLRNSRQTTSFFTFVCSVSKENQYKMNRTVVRSTKLK